MPEKIEPSEAVEILQDAMVGAEAIAERKTELAGYAGSILAAKAKLVIAKEGMFGGTPGLIGSAEHGVALLRATEPVTLGEVHVALRDQNDEHLGAIELIITDTDKAYDAGHYGNNNVAATLSSRMLELPNTEIVTRDQIDAVESVLSHIDGTLEPIEENVPNRIRLPQIVTRGPWMSDGVHTLQDLSEAIDKQNQEIRQALGM